MKDKSIIAAEKLLESYRIGTFSRFCDDPPDFDGTKIEEIAAIIKDVYEQPSN